MMTEDEFQRAVLDKLDHVVTMLQLVAVGGDKQETPAETLADQQRRSQAHAMWYRAMQSDTLSVECARCGALPGERCRRSGGQLVGSDTFASQHASRLDWAHERNGRYPPN